VVYGGVELTALRIGCADEIQLCQLCVPQCSGCGLHGVEVPDGDFLLHVLLCLLCADEGDADFGLDDLVGFRDEVEGGSDGCTGADFGVSFVGEGFSGPGLCGFGGRVEHHVVEDAIFAASVPAPGEARHALGFVIGGEVDLCAEKCLRLPTGAQSERGCDVDGDVRLLRGRKGVAVKTDATAAGQFGFHLIVTKFRSIVANLVDLVGALRLDVAWVERAGDGSDEDVAVLSLRAAEVEM
jgi:hypothetical protein